MQQWVWKLWPNMKCKLETLISPNFLKSWKRVRPCGTGATKNRLFRPFKDKIRPMAVAENEIVGKNTMMDESFRRERDSKWWFRVELRTRRPRLTATMKSDQRSEVKTRQERRLALTTPLWNSTETKYAELTRCSNFRLGQLSLN
jgi:hypothetical protein